MNYIIVGIGQSNCVGQGASPYTVVNTSAYAKLFKNNGTLSGLSDPWDTEAVTSSGDIDYDSSVGASWTPSCANILTSAIPLTRFVFVPTCVTSTGYSNIGNNGTDWGYRNPSNHADVTTLYGNFVDRVNAAKNKLGDATNDQIFVVAIGGETDGVQSRTYYATYKALINLSTWIKEDIGSNTKIILFAPGRCTNLGTDQSWTNVRKAHVDAATDTDNMIFAGHFIDLVLKDNIHYDKASQDIIGKRVAYAILSLINGSKEYRPPVIQSLTTNNNHKITVNILRYGGTKLTPNNPTGFKVYNNTNTIGISSISHTNDTYTLNLSASITGTRNVQYLCGAMPIVTSAIKDDSIIVQGLIPYSEINTITKLNNWYTENIAYGIFPKSLKVGTNPNSFASGRFPCYRSKSSIGTEILPMSGYGTNQGYVASAGIIANNASGYISSNITETWSSTMNATYEMWIDYVNTATSQFIFTIYDSASNYVSIYINRTNRHFNCTVNINTTIVQADSDNSNIVNDGLNHLAVVICAGIIKLYINGIPVTGYAIAPTVIVGSRTFTTKVKIGNYNNNLYLTSKLHSFVKYNSPLTPEEIAYNYSLGARYGETLGYINNTDSNLLDLTVPTILNTSAWNGTINTTYADIYQKPYYQAIAPFTDCYGKNGGRVDHLLSAQNYIPTQPIRKILITSAGNLSIKFLSGSVMTRKWKSDTIIDNIVVTAIMSASINTSASQAKEIYPLW